MCISNKYMPKIISILYSKDNVNLYYLTFNYHFSIPNILNESL